MSARPWTPGPRRCACPKPAKPRWRPPAPRVDAADKRILALLPKAKRDGFLARLADLAGAADAAPEAARVEAKAAKKAAKLAKKAAKADRPKRLKLVEPA